MTEPRQRAEYWDPDLEQWVNVTGWTTPYCASAAVYHANQTSPGRYRYRQVREGRSCGDGVSERAVTVGPTEPWRRVR